MIKIYGKVGCGSCINAQNYCKERGLEYEYLSMGKDYKLSEFVEIGGVNHKTFPLITKDGVYVGTFANLQALYK